MQISFGMIFSILIIIFTIATAFYVISVFLRTKSCVDAGFFYDKLDNKAGAAWRATAVSDILTLDVPAKVKAVCFGNLTEEGGTQFVDDAKMRDELRKSIAATRSGANVFLYPMYEGCEGKFPYHKIEHITVENFFCVRAVDGKITINLKKGVFDPLVKISRQNE